MFFGTSENAVKTQIWIYVSTYLLIAIAKKRLHLDHHSLYEILQILSLSMFEAIPVNYLRHPRRIQTRISSTISLLSSEERWDTTELDRYVKIGNLKNGIRLGIGFGLLIAMMLIMIANTGFATAGQINRRITEKDRVEVEAANARRTMEPLIATDKSHVANANERIEAKQKTINEVLAALDKLIDLPEGLRIAPTANTKDS